MEYFFGTIKLGYANYYVVIEYILVINTTCDFRIVKF